MISLNKNELPFICFGVCFFFFSEFNQNLFYLLKKVVQVKSHSSAISLSGHTIIKCSDVVQSTGSTEFSPTLFSDSTGKLKRCAWSDSSVCSWSQEVSVHSFPGYGSVW